MTYLLHLPIDLPSANAHQVNGRDRRIAAIYRKARNGYAAALTMEAARLGVPRYPHAVYPAQEDGTVKPVPLDQRPPFRSITITRLMGKTPKGRWQQPFDYGNLVGGCKHFVDAMQVARVRVVKGKVPTLVPGAGLVWDDSARWARFEYGQERSVDGRPGVRIAITDEERP